MGTAPGSPEEEQGVGGHEGGYEDQMLQCFNASMLQWPIWGYGQLQIAPFPFPATPPVRVRARSCSLYQVPIPDEMRT